MIRYLLIDRLQGAIHTLIPFSFAWLLRSGAGAIGLSVLPWLTTTMVPLWVRENVLRYLPDNAKDSLLGQLEPGSSPVPGRHRRRHRDRRLDGRLARGRGHRHLELA